MARKRKGNPVHGWVIIDKPVEMGSTPVVGKVRYLFKAQKAGHGGTLDPFATGLLPIALGEATKTVNYVMDGAKTYRFTLKWGAETDSCDHEGTVVETSDHRPSEAEILAVLDSFQGLLEQVPPVFSAIKIDGQRAYDLARAGKPVEMKSREVRCDAVRLLEIIDQDHAVFEVDCGKGFYVRALGRDLARKLGTRGHLTQLRRTKVGPFDESNAISLDVLEEKAHNPAELADALLPIEVALDGIPALTLNEAETQRLRNGQAVTLLRKIDLDRISRLKDGDTAVAFFKKQAVALVSYEKGAIKPIRVLVYSDTVK
ncbi:tRNA pseudouridine(55) synthase TruB [Aestuariispira insulae]|uniref:tRNA pseudouridine synthase B n=1 Tax=Aestuariispira insulae TaxID=1461337 RepID=A0A3D9HPV9_9PROT|nr:tRNA pseudouridine(55) synthase TruB [Aestuariispira insulae]RED51510.1 tRNA pseudouridine synthase B [Aestuariispira insulae]